MRTATGSVRFGALRRPRTRLEGRLLQFLAVNWLAVLVAAVVNMVVGFLWYGPLFSGTFLRLIGKREEEIEGSPVVYLLGFVMGLVTTYVLAVIIGSAAIRFCRRCERRESASASSAVSTASSIPRSAPAKTSRMAPRSGSCREIATAARWSASNTPNISAC